MTIWEHLEELRQRLKIVLISLLVCTTFFMLFPANPSELLKPETWIGGFYRPIVLSVLNWIRQYSAPSGLQVISLEIGSPLEVYVLASMFLGVVLSAPIIGYEVYNFVNPGLYPHERRAVYPFIIAFTMLFSIGALFGLLILAPFVVWTLILFSEFVASQPVLSVLDFYSTIFTTVVLSGFSFTLPAIFVLLVKLGILKTLIITENRAYFYGALYIITAVITPDGGPLADLALFIPVVLMIEASVYIAKRYEKQREVTSIGDKTESNGANRCKFCGHKLRRWEIFCSNCDRSQI